MPYQLRPCDAGQDAPYQCSVSPRRMLFPDVAAPSAVDVDASEVQTAGGTLVETPVQRHQCRLTAAVDQAVDKRDQVEVADAKDVVAGGQRSRDEQIADLSQSLQLPAELDDNGRQGHHDRSLGKPAQEPPIPNRPR